MQNPMQINRQIQAKTLETIKTNNEARNRYDNPVLDIAKSIEQQITDFNNSLDNIHEVMIMAASFGSQVIFYVDQIEFNKPNVIIFYGPTTDGDKTRLIQHVNQLNFLLQSAPKAIPEMPKRQIGFIHN